MKRIATLFMVLISISACRVRQEPPLQPIAALIPQPLHLAVSGGRFACAPDTVFLSASVDAAEGVETAENDRRQAGRLLRDFRDWLTLHGWIEASARSAAPEGPRATVAFSVEPGEARRLGDEGYALKIAGDTVALRAARPAGLFYGVQTLRQLLLARPVGAPLALPCLEIVDKPRYTWRGFMLDCCRHFFPKEFIKKCLDEMALFKLNRFHWHLTEDQAWRLEIKKYPLLAEKGGVPTGGFYSQDDVREIVAYAAERFITVVPEIEMPGHATAALTAYPELACTGGPFATMAQWGVFEDVYCAGNERTFAFLQNILDEVTELFPGPWVHVGGDECPKSRWKACPKCQARMQAEALKDEAELQSWFIRRVEKHLDLRAKRLIGWDEILEGGLAPAAAVMSWRGMAGGIKAVRQGHDVVMAPTSSAYLDYYQGDPRFEPPAIGGFLPLKTVYEFEATPTGLAPQEASHILGGQANLWTEYVPAPEHASYMMWPRLAALAEAVWSTPAGRDWDSFLSRLGNMRPGLESIGMRVAPTMWRPVITAKALPAKRAWRIEMASGLSDATIRYSRGGFGPGQRSSLYRGPFTGREGGAVWAALFQGRKQLAPAVNLRLREHLGMFATVRVRTSGRLRPEQGGETLLADGLSGSLRHQDGAWLGVEGGDLQAIIDLGRSREMRRVAARFLEHPSAWIFLPIRVEVEISDDERNWTRAAACDWPFTGDLTVLRSREADLRFTMLTARYVRLIVRGIGSCPAGHTGAGGKAWLFVDEIAVE